MVAVAIVLPTLLPLLSISINSTVTPAPTGAVPATAAACACEGNKLANIFLKLLTGWANAIEPVVVPGADTIPVILTAEPLDELPPVHPVKLNAIPMAAAYKIFLEILMPDPL